MKLTTSAALAVAATGAAAQDSWSAWSSTSAKPVSATTCAAPVTTVKTETTTAYQSTSEVYKSTVTVPIPEKPVSFSIESEWADWETTSASVSPTSVGTTSCAVGKTVTSTSTITSTIAGTVTITKSILFVGAKISDSPTAAWNNWNPSGASASVSTPKATSGSGSWSDSGSGSGSGSWSGSGSGSSSVSWSGSGSSSGSYSSDTSGSDDGLNGNAGWGQGSWGGKGNGGLVLGEGADVYHFEPEAPSNTKSGAAPTYTRKPDGSYGGTPWGGVGDWGTWNDDGSDSGSGSGSGGDGNGGKGGKSNSTTPVNGTAADWGSAGSNVTKPFSPLTDSSCNTAADRSKWCGGLDIDTDYYTDYFGDFQGKGPAGGLTSGISGLTGNKCSKTLTLSKGTWNADGTDTEMMLVNGQFPGPAIECNWGDLVEITVINNIDGNGTTIHWHGVRQVGTNDQDGVPGVTECAVAPGSSRTYTWRASSYGTSWYHSHWNLQYGDGIQGPIIIHGPATANYDIDAGPVMLADTYGMSATAFGSLIAHLGPKPTVNYLLNGKNSQVDLSAGQHSLWTVKSGKKYLFRIINAAAQNMYSVTIDQHKLKVIAADFVPVVPYETDYVNIGIGQRYDVVVEMNQAPGNYFFRAITQTLCPAGSINSGLGQANGIIAYDVENLAKNATSIILPTSTLNGNKTAADFAICYDEPLASLVPHLKKDAGTSSAFTASASTLPAGTVQAVNTADDGVVFRWFLNNGAMYVNYTQPTLQSLSDGYTPGADNGTIFANEITLNQKDQWVYFVIQNQFFAFHPMHLHGHDFSVLGQGDGLFTADLVSTLNFDNPIRRDTAMLRGAASPRAPSGGYTVIGFETDNPGAWLMHCHIAWHVDGGLALQWIERPDDMGASGYTSKTAFKDECSTYAAYEAESPSHKKFSGQSGLKRREATYFDKLKAEASRHFNSVVRRDEHANHHFLDSHLKRGLGDGGARTFGRRR